MLQGEMYSLMKTKTSKQTEMFYGSRKIVHQITTKTIHDHVTRPISLTLPIEQNQRCINVSFVRIIHVRSSRTEEFCKKGVTRDFVKFTGKHLCQSLIFNKVAGLWPATLLKKRLWYRCFPVNFAEIF